MLSGKSSRLQTQGWVIRFSPARLHVEVSTSTDMYCLHNQFSTGIHNVSAVIIIIFIIVGLHFFTGAILKHFWLILNPNPPFFFFYYLSKPKSFDSFTFSGIPTRFNPTSSHNDTSHFIQMLKVLPGVTVWGTGCVWKLSHGSWTSFL